MRPFNQGTNISTYNGSRRDNNRVKVRAQLGEFRSFGIRLTRAIVVVLLLTTPALAAPLPHSNMVDVLAPTLPTMPTTAVASLTVEPLGGGPAAVWNIGAFTQADEGRTVKVTG